MRRGRWGILKNSQDTMLVVLTVIAIMIYVAVFVATIIPRQHSEEGVRLFGAEFLKRADEYARTRYMSWVARSSAVLMALILMLSYRYGESFIEGRGNYSSEMGSVIAASLGALLILTVATFPFDLYTGFFIERRFGFLTQSMLSWLSDYVKSTVITYLIAVFALSALIFVSRRFPGTWWLVATGGYACFIILSAMLSPVLVDPIFHRFTPVTDTSFTNEVMRMSEAAGIRVDEVLEMDASRKTMKVNAYFTGVGRTKRIVIYDNLLRRYPKRQSLLVIAHEIGHWSKGHIRNGILLGSVFGFIYFVILRSICGSPLCTKDLPVILMLAFLLSTVALPASNLISRAQERAADQTVFELTKDTMGWIDLETRLSFNNLTDVEPHPIIKAVLFSHPSALERIGAAEEYPGTIQP